MNSLNTENDSPRNEARLFPTIRTIACLSLSSLLSSSAFALPELIELPYTSPSTGADGPLIIPDTLPIASLSSSPIQLVYHESFDYMLAASIIASGSDFFHTYGYVDGVWDSLESERYYSEGAIAYHAARGEMMKFGGYNDFSDRYLQNTQIWDGEQWEFRYTSLEDPDIRGRAGMVYDAARQVIVLFGGENDDDEFNDTWTWDGDQWTKQSPTNVPDERNYPAMAYDAARQEVVMFGGQGNGWLDDTWTWNGSDWTQESPTNIPPDDFAAMDYDPNRQVVVLVAHASDTTVETWEWDGSDWTQRSSSVSPPNRRYHDVVYNPNSQLIELYNGDYTDGDDDRTADTWTWDGTDWTRFATSPTLVDMSEKPDGIWNFTTIEIGQTIVEFTPNEANTPVVWLATGDVEIRGTIDISGEDDAFTTEEEINQAAPGGPGGFAGGLGGLATVTLGENAPGFPGIGPGGGEASDTDDLNGDWDGRHGTFSQSYGSESLQALVGGSGGGGARTTGCIEGTTDWSRGGSGGGGGGAILIASSGNIFLNGRILAPGGEGGIERNKSLSSSFFQTGATRGGSGSGGAVRLVADRVLGGGFVDVTTDAHFQHDFDEGAPNFGRVRIEAYYHRVNTSNQVDPSVAFPKQTGLGSNLQQLAVASIAGQSVSSSPSSDPSMPEVTFSEAGDITVLVTAQNVPDATLINLRVTSNNVILTPAPVALAGGEASFTLTVPAGSGTVQAYADWTN